MHKLNDKYNPKEFEDKLYSEWEQKGYFKPSGNKSKGNYSIVMPPPNVTGKLHMGHALDGTIQDLLIRYKRMILLFHHKVQSIPMLFLRIFLFQYLIFLFLLFSSVLLFF